MNGSFQAQIEKKREENLAHGDADGNLEELLPNRFDLDPVVPGAGEVDSPKRPLLLARYQL